MQKTLTILFADVANSTRLYQNNGDVIAHRLIADCLDGLRCIVEMHDGQLLKTVGDAVLASFASAEDAMKAAIKSQRLQAESPLSIRIGFHTGEVIPDAGDVFGNTVNVAARVSSFANAEEIYTTEDTVRLLSKEMRSTTTFLDFVEFKGIHKPLPVYRVQWQDDSLTSLASGTRIITAVRQSEKPRSDTALELSYGTNTIRVDESNKQIRIGREVDNDIIIDHESTSRHHAVIEYRLGRFSITDSSTNGTFVVREGTNAQFVRRETAGMESTGIVGAGWLPSSSDKDCISFRRID